MLDRSIQHEGYAMANSTEERAVSVLRARLIERRSMIDEMVRRITRRYGEHIRFHKISRLQRKLRVERDHILELLEQLKERS